MQARLQRANTQRLFDQPTTWIMGVVNVTPDSFWAGARTTATDVAVARAEAMLDEGADVIDLGAESTRPGARPVAVQDELDRLLPVVETLVARRPAAILSIDTQKAAVAAACLERGACIINDVSGLRADPEMARVAADHQTGLIIMHMQGTPETMQKMPTYQDIVSEIGEFFERQLKVATLAGVSPEQIALDPGIGFGKALGHNVTILQRLPELKRLGRPLVIGTSRKSFLGALAVDDGKAVLPVEERLEASLASALFAVHRGARGLRVHDVSATKRALSTWQHLNGSGANQ